MDFSIASILLLDGLTNGAVYALLGLATVLVFTVTRVIFIPQGEFVAYGALTLAMLQTGKTPGTVWLLLILAGVAALMELVERWRHQGKPLRALRAALKTLVFPVIVSVLASWAAKRWKKSSLILRTEPSIRRAPSWASLPPTWASACQSSRVWSGASSVSVTRASPLPKPATPPWPAKRRVQAVGGAMSSKVMVLLKRAETGPMLTLTLLA